MQKIRLDKQSIVFIVLGLLLLVQLFVFLPWGLKKISRANREIESLNQRIELIELDWPQKENYLERSNQLEEKIAKHQGKTIKPGQESQLISFISRNTQDYNIRVISTTPLDSFAADDSSFSYVPFKVEVEGAFHSLGNFLGFLSEADYFIEVRKIRIDGYNPSKIDLILCGLREE